MSIFDAFNFKKKFQEIATKENFDLLRAVIKEEIKKQAKENSKKGEEKMNAVVEKAIAYIKKHMHSSNSLVQWIVDNVLIKGIRNITQAIYNDLKEIIENL